MTRSLRPVSEINQTPSPDLATHPGNWPAGRPRTLGEANLERLLGNVPPSVADGEEPSGRPARPAGGGERSELAVKQNNPDRAAQATVEGRKIDTETMEDWS